MVLLRWRWSTLLYLTCGFAALNGWTMVSALPKILPLKPPSPPPKSNNSTNNIATKTTIAASKVKTELTNNMTKSRIDRFLEKMFNDTDADHDGTISFQEAYEGVLKFYITLNRQAPIPPPSREKVKILYQQADKTRNNKLDRVEYGKLLERTVRRALFRLAVHKSVTIVGAPLLAEVIVHKLAHKKEWLERVSRHVVPLRFQDKVIPVITSKGFHRAIWITILVAFLGNFCLNIVNFFLDLSLSDPNAAANKTKKEK